MNKKILLTALAFGSFLLSVAAQIPLSAERVVVSNERRVNSDELEFSPVFYKDGIVFISTRFESLIYNVKDKNIDGKNIMSIYRSERDGEGFLQAPVPLANELIFRYHEGPVAFGRTGEVILFTRNESLEQASDGMKKLQVYGAEKQGETWGNIQKLKFNNVNYNYCHPTLSADEDMMVIASDIPGGYGGMDLYVVYQVNGDWVQMINLGDKVNTAGNEVFPYLAADGTLYFSSDGQVGFGGLDIFYSTENELTEEWRKPVNLGPPFNSPWDDFGLIVDRDNKNGYFSSDRKGGFGGDDIYNFHIEGEGDLPIAMLGNGLEGLVVSDEDGNPMEGALVSTINFKDISLVADDDQKVTLKPGDGHDDFVLDVNALGLGESTLTNASGQADLPMQRENYVLKVTKDGYLPQYIVVTPDTDLDELDIVLERAIDCVMLSGKVIRENSTTAIAGATVKIVDVETHEAITIYSDGMGNYEYCISCNRIYSIYAEKNGNTSAPNVISTKDITCNEANSTMELDIFIGGSPLYAGMTIRLPNIYFNFDDARLRPDAYRDLDEVVGMLNAFPEMRLELASHTDARGGKSYNQNLSDRRSVSVMDYLVSKGITSQRLEPRGYGESQVRNHCRDGISCTESEHQYNRRTEVKILELGTPSGESAPVASTSPNENGFTIEPVAFEESKANEAKGGQDATGTEPSSVTEQPAKVETPPAPTARTRPRKNNRISSYTVIAGTFANHDNAVRRAKELTGLGYFETNIVHQPRSGLYAVYVNTFKEKNAAFSLVKKLAQDQLHSYVLRK